MPATAQELERRAAAFARERRWVGAIGYLPLLLVYVLVHTPYLRAYVSTDKAIEALELLGLPLGWFALVMLLHQRFGPRRHGLACDACAARLVGPAFKTALTTGRCAGCSAAIVAATPVSAR